MLYTGVRNSLPKLRALGPYLLIEMVLPGGTLLALLLWLVQRFRRTGAGAMRWNGARRAAVPPATEGKPHEDGEAQSMRAPPPGYCRSEAAACGCG